MKKKIKKSLPAIISIVIVMILSVVYLTLGTNHSNLVTQVQRAVSLEWSEERIQVVEEEPDADTGDSYIHMLNLWNSDGSHGTGNMKVWKNAETSMESPQIIYGWFGDPPNAYSLYCIDFGKILTGGDTYVTSEEYDGLSDEQKKAISYVLGCARIIQAPKNEGFNNYGGDVTYENWKLYNSTQLMIWYYIDRYYCGTNEGISWEDGVKRTCEAGWGNLEECIRIRNIVDHIQTIPSFAQSYSEEKPSYEMSYNSNTGKYEVILQDVNAFCSLERFEWKGDDLQFMRCNESGTADENGRCLKVSSSVPIEQENRIDVIGSYTPMGGDIVYVRNQSSASEKPQDLIECSQLKEEEPVQAFFSVYTKGSASIEVQKVNGSNETSGSGGFKGAEYGVFTEDEKTLVATIVMNDVGYGRADHLPLGIYKVKEIKSPLNGWWQTDPKVYTADCRIPNTTDSIALASITSKEIPITGKIEIYKTNALEEELDSDWDFAGAEFTIYTMDHITYKGKNYDKEEAIATVTTNKKGEASIDGLPIGGYAIRETKVPDNGKWKKNEETFLIDLSMENTSVPVRLEVEEEPYTANIEIYKTNAKRELNTGDATLEKAEYTVYTTSDIHFMGVRYAKGDAIGVITTNTMGYGRIEGLPLGIYTIKETKSSPGYALDPNTYTAVCTEPDTTVGVALAQIDSVEQPILTDYHICKYKTDIKKEENLYPLADCEFALYLISELDQSRFEYNEDGSLNFANYDFSGEEPVQRAVTDQDGKAVFHDCYYGSYVVVETKVGDPKCKAITPYVVKLPVSNGTDGYETDVFQPLIDEWIYGRLKVVKKDTLTGEKISGAATYKIYNIDEQKYESLLELTDQGTVEHTEFTTDAEGAFYFYDKLKAGHYILEEVEASNWYDIGDIEFYLDEEKVRYRSLDWEGNPSGDWVTSAVCTEDNGMEFYVIEAFDTPHRVSIKKVDENGDYLRGAVLGIVIADKDGKEPMKRADGTYELLQIPQMSDGKLIWNEMGNTVTMTDAVWLSERSLISCDYIPTGDYFLVELIPPAGYAAADAIPFSVGNQVEMITIEGTEQILDHRNQTLIMQDRKLQVYISKKDITTDEELAGAELEVINEEGEIIEHWISTDEEHQLDITNVTPGTYRLREILAPAGYAIADEIEFEITASDVKQKVVMYNERQARVRVAKTGERVMETHKIASEFGDITQFVYEQQPLPGVTFTIYNADTDEVVSVFTTGTDAVTYSDYLPIGQGQKYYMRETGTPAGYVQTGKRYDLEFIWEEDTEEYLTDVITIENQLADIEIRIDKEAEILIPDPEQSFKIDLQKLAGVYFGVYADEDLYNSEGQKVAVKDTLLGIGITNAEGIAQIQGKLPQGQYYWKELKTVEGYLLNQEHFDFEIHLQENETERHVVFEVNKEEPLINLYDTAKVIVNKTGEEGEVLEGVVFSLYRNDEKIGTYTTDENGQIIIEKLPYGAYYWKEEQGVKGYFFDTEIKYEFEVSEGGNKEIEITVINEKNKETPVTGTSVKIMMVLTIAILSLIICAGIIGIAVRRKHLPHTDSK